jgi:hypothetical protein
MSKTMYITGAPSHLTSIALNERAFHADVNHNTALPGHAALVSRDDHFSSLVEHYGSEIPVCWDDTTSGKRMTGHLSLQSETDDHTSFTLVADGGEHPELLHNNPDHAHTHDGHPVSSEHDSSGLRDHKDLSTRSV